jgi:hypothetical protein
MGKSCRDRLFGAMLERDTPPPSAVLQGASGALSGVLSLALMYPLDNIRTRMQVRHAPRCCCRSLQLACCRSRASLAH